MSILAKLTASPSWLGRLHRRLTGDTCGKMGLSDLELEFRAGGMLFSMLIPGEAFPAGGVGRACAMLESYSVDEPEVVWRFPCPGTLSCTGRSPQMPVRSVSVFHAGFSPISIVWTASSMCG